MLLANEHYKRRTRMFFTVGKTASLASIVGLSSIVLLTLDLHLTFLRPISVLTSHFFGPPSEHFWSPPPTKIQYLFPVSLQTAAHRDTHFVHILTTTEDLHIWKLRSATTLKFHLTQIFCQKVKLITLFWNTQLWLFLSQDKEPHFTQSPV